MIPTVEIQSGIQYIFCFSAKQSANPAQKITVLAGKPGIKRSAASKVKPVINRSSG